MLIMNYDPVTGWSAPEIKPYAPLVLDPMSSCFQYCPNVFEGMKVRIYSTREPFNCLLVRCILRYTPPQAYLGPDGEPRLFRPERNMARLARSAERVALPVRFHRSSPDLHLIQLRVLAAAL